MLTIVCWKWKKHKSGFQLPGVVPYTAHHVNVLRNMLERHCHIPFRFVCLTDDPRGIECETLPVPTRYAELGGAFDRFQDLFPGRIVSQKTDMKNNVLPPGASVVCFHGKPKPWEVKADWIPKLDTKL